MEQKNKIPSQISKGDRIRIVSPSGAITPEIIDNAEKMLLNAGYEVIVGKHAKCEYFRFAGTAEERLSDLQEAFNDQETKAIFCSRGGYGAIQILDNIDMTGFRKNPKWLIGFSDITAIHVMLQFHGYASMHAPMLKHLTEQGWGDKYVCHMFDILEGRKVEYSSPGNLLNRTGHATGILKGGNLAVLNGLRGTKYDYIPKDTILILEDTGERPYQIDRMLWNLKIGGIFDNISGLIIGSFTGYEDDMSMGKNTYGIISDIIAQYDFPVCFGFPVGHTEDNEPLVLGAKVELCVSTLTTTLKYIQPLKK